MVQPRGRERELSILRVVLELLGENGYERLTIDAVAARARTSKATIYSRWPDKSTLVAAALNARSGDLPRLLPAGSDLREDLASLVALFVQFAENESLTVFMSVLIAAENEPVLAEAFHGTALEPRRQDCNHIVARAIASGEAAADSSGEELFELVMGKVLVRYVIEQGRLTAADQAAFIERVLIPALGRPAPN